MMHCVLIYYRKKIRSINHFILDYKLITKESNIKKKLDQADHEVKEDLFNSRKRKSDVHSVYKMATLRVIKREKLT